MKLVEQIDRIKIMIDINENTENRDVRLVDLLIKSMFGEVSMVKFRDFNEDEYAWIINDDGSIDYGNMGYNRYVSEYGEDNVLFYKNNWGKLFIFNCNFFQSYLDNFVLNRGEDKEHGFINQKHYNMIKDYMKEKYGLNIKNVDAFECDQW